MILGQEFRGNAVNENTPNNILFGAGTVHKNLKYGYFLLKEKPNDWNTSYTSYYQRSGSEGSYQYDAITGATAPAYSADTYYYKGWNARESELCATSGGSKFSIVPEYQDIEVDGYTVKGKGLSVKVGESATMEINPIEFTTEIMVTALDGEVVDYNDEYNAIQSKDTILAGNYYDNIAFVGKTVSGQPIIAILENALCTSGFEVESKNKENAKPKLKFECTSDNGKTLPWKIIYPKLQTTQPQAQTEQAQD